MRMRSQYGTFKLAWPCFRVPPKFILQIDYFYRDMSNDNLQEKRVSSFRWTKKDIKNTIKMKVYGFDPTGKTRGTKDVYKIQPQDHGIAKSD